MKKCLVVVGVVAGLTACGSSPSQFIGTWQITSGSVVVTCGTQTTTVNVTGNETIAAGSNGMIVVTTTNCQESFTVDSADTGATATNVQCPIELNGTAAIFDISSDALTRSGQVLSEAASGSTISNGQTCSVVQSSTATRIDT